MYLQIKNKKYNKIKGSEFMIIVLVGPTAVGKTKLSIELAKIYNGEIINADSTQVYRGLNIGTAKVTEREKSGIPHHLIDICSPCEEYNLYNYQKDCREAIAAIQKRNKVPIIVGGTGLYIKAALYNYELTSEASKDMDFASLTNEQIYEKIMAYDNTIVIDSHNRRRLVRCLNKIQKSTYQKPKDLSIIYNDVYFIGLTTDQEILYEKINSRFDTMLVDLVDEVKDLYRQYPSSRVLQSAIGYKELISFFNDECTFKDSIAKIKQNTRNYAKRQYTFFRHQLPVKWFTTDYADFTNTINAVVNYIEKD